MPGVAEVTASAVESPSNRVVHLLNWHRIPEDRFKLDDPDGDYQSFLDELEAVQQEQMTLLRAMKDRVVFYEGLTTENLALYKRKIERLRRMKPRKGDDPIDELLARFIREDLLQLGAPGRLWMEEEIDAVLPTDDSKLLDAADPVRDGKIQFDAQAVRAREQGIVKILLKQKEAVVVMGGAHNLADNLPANVSYVRLTTRRYKQAAE
ncbi:MAG: hypothetical protein AABP62_05320 [Planctomycetota bacterium]